MRLSKHTPEEIEIAKRESGDATPTPKQLEEWRKVQDAVNGRIKHNVELEHFGSGSRIVNLSGVILPMLGKAGLRVANGIGTNTVIELIKNNKTGKHFPWYKSGLLGYEHITEEALEGIDCDRVCILSRFMNKVIEVDKGDEDKIGYWIKRFAATFNLLAANNKIDYGILCPFMAMPLADLDAEAAGEKALIAAHKAGARLSVESLKKIEAIREKVRSESKTRRITLMVYPYSHYDNEELNEWLGNPVFVEEGDLGTTDWTGLPEV